VPKPSFTVRRSSHDSHRSRLQASA
jgi:hypothetical protein